MASGPKERGKRGKIGGNVRGKEGWGEIAAAGGPVQPPEDGARRCAGLSTQRLVADRWNLSGGCQGRGAPAITLQLL